MMVQELKHSWNQKCSTGIIYVVLPEPQGMHAVASASSSRCSMTRLATVTETRRAFTVPPKVCWYIPLWKAKEGGDGKLMPSFTSRTVSLWGLYHLGVSAVQPLLPDAQGRCAETLWRLWNSTYEMVSYLRLWWCATPVGSCSQGGVIALTTETFRMPCKSKV